MNKRFTALMTTLILSVFFSISASAYDIEVDGIYYKLISKIKVAEVTNGDNQYSGDITIPSSIKVNKSEYTVKEIKEYAFSYCSSLTSVTIPNSVTNIGDYAFSGCSGLTSITIPKSITSIGYEAFSHCTGLTSATILSPVTSIGDFAFFGCSSLTSITIPNSITGIGDRAFCECTSLTSISIPSSIKRIEYGTFEGCTSLTSVVIPDSVTGIGDRAFYGCTGLTSVTIPNSVNYIGQSTFFGCRGLTSLTIPNSVTDINGYAFASCDNLENVYCYSIKHYNVCSDIFNDSYIEYATLHVPSSAITYFQTTKPWSGFGTIKTIEGTDVETKKCATPSISYSDGHLKFTCDTEGAKCYYTLNNSDVKTGETLAESNNVNLSACYDITCYAKAEGFINSDLATAKLYWLTSSGSLEGAGINNVSMRGIAIQSAGGFVTISGLDNNEKVSFYGIDGKTLGIATAINGTTTFAAQSGSIVVAKIGKENIKIAVK